DIVINCTISSILVEFRDQSVFRSQITTLPHSNYQFLQRSSVPMLHFQASLPRLPIPELSATCTRYLEAQQPLLTPEAHATTTKLTQDFQNGPGKELQVRLKAVDSANKHTSYISEPWFEMYLSDRAPLPVNYTPLLGMKLIPAAGTSVATQVANILITSARFMRALRARSLAPEVFHLNPQTADSALWKTAVKLSPQIGATYVSYAFKAFPLDMSQYQGLFSATRIPQEGKDKIFRASSDPQHVVIMRRGNIYRLDILDRDGNIESPSVILGRIRRLMATSEAHDSPQHPLGIMTTQNRNQWAQFRQHLEGLSERNRRNLQLLDSGILCVCLDDISYSPEDVTCRVRDYLFSNASNRWFDKSLSVTVSKDTRAAITFEHSWGDGVAVLRYFNELYKELSTQPIVTDDMEGSANDEAATELLSFDYDDKLKAGIETALKNHSEVENSLDVNYMMSDVGKKHCKAVQVSPDAVAQLTIQLAYALISGGGTTATYESCSTAAFRCGRTETVRPATMATRALCQHLLTSKGHAGPEELALLRQCSDKHTKLTKEAAMGQGFDRHLFVLRVEPPRGTGERLQ
uniref:Choline/carnitine acyltransferase domain-containing protein n=1 Tax=Phlebotomus papatasi TaxID=29031 RepID=A0A1B0D7K2_PHLPP